MIDKESQEELRIGYAPSPTAVIISRVLCRYHELSPGARLTLHDLTHTEMLSGLRAGKLHAALTIRPPAGEMRGLKFETTSLRCDRASRSNGSTGLNWAICRGPDQRLQRVDSGRCSRPTARSSATKEQLRLEYFEVRSRTEKYVVTYFLAESEAKQSDPLERGRRSKSAETRSRI